MEVQEFTLPAGTICKRNGIPFELLADTVIRCHPANWVLASEQSKTVEGLQQSGHGAEPCIADEFDALYCMYGMPAFEQAANEIRRLNAELEAAIDAIGGAYALAIGHAAVYQHNHQLPQLHPVHAEILAKARGILEKHKAGAYDAYMAASSAQEL